MKLYKRNQIEAAIARTLGESSHEPSSELRTRLKRLLDLDRTLGRNVKSVDPQKAYYAFYSENPPGKGVEIMFSEYEAFAMLTGLRLLQHGWPQGFAVDVLRGLRPELETQHARILRQDPGKLFDTAEIKKKAKPGSLYVDNTDPVFLTIVSRQEGASEASPALPPCGVCRGLEEVSDFLKRENAQSYTLFELVTAAHSLSAELAKAQPRRRGRAN